MNRSSIIALLIFVAILGYLLSFGPESQRNLQAGFYQIISPFLTTARASRSKSPRCAGLEDARRAGARQRSLKTENRSLKATNQALRDVEREVNRCGQALAYRERSSSSWCRRRS
jgi:hypothetical protein